MHEKFIACQPIFDDKLKLFAYDLLFRAGGDKNVFQPGPEAASSVIVDSVTLFALQALTGPAKAFINLDAPARLLPPNRVIIEILETVVPSPEVVQHCKDPCSSGYILALDDFDDLPKWEPLLPLVHFLKVDFRASDVDARRATAQRFRTRGMHSSPKRSRPKPDLNEASSLGYTFLQGYFFCKPAMVSARDISGTKVNCLRLLEAVSSAEFSHDVVEGLLKQDPALVYKLLRFLNAPLFGLRSEVRSIRVAMASDKPPELIRTAPTPAFFCEQLSHPVGMAPQSSDLFMMGLLSVTDAILDRPIGHILEGLPVSADLRTALCGGANRYRDIFETLLTYSRGDWAALASTASRIGQIEEAIPDCHQSAATRATSFSPNSLGYGVYPAPRWGAAIPDAKLSCFHYPTCDSIPP